MTSLFEFQAWPKIPRLSKPVIFTEKLDGTNACVVIEPWDAMDYVPIDAMTVTPVDGPTLVLYAQSRTRIITPEHDNFGFAAWAWMNAVPLVELLGEGRHFGEWWGAGIQRRYGKLDKTFSLFNTSRWKDLASPDFQSPTKYGNISVVPVLGYGSFAETPQYITSLRLNGSVAAPGFMQPEGLVAYHTGSKQTYKAFCEDDDKPKGEANA